jgi:hypothetical protein
VDVALFVGLLHADAPLQSVRHLPGPKARQLDELTNSSQKQGEKKNSAVIMTLPS